MRKITVTTPGKLIITGEHSVVYGCPALAVPAHLNVTGILEFTELETIQFQTSLGLSSFALNGLQVFRSMIGARYQAYLDHEISVKEVLPKPEALLFFTVATFQNQYHVRRGIRILLDSKIPIGAGMGSSAAVIVTILALLYDAFEIAHSQEELLSLAKQCENLQHGQSSGLDIAVTGSKSPILYSNATILPFKPSGFSIYVVQTGIPTSSTGDCVDFVKSQFNAEFKEEFTKTSNEIIDALTHKKVKLFKKAIQENQLLLEKLGVVPDKIIEFRKALHIKYSANFKISGAGSILGDNAGMGLIVSKSNPKELCKLYGYKIWEIKI